MISRAVDIVGFAVCAGAAGVWAIFSPERLHSVLLAAGIVFYIRWDRRRRPAQEEDPDAIRRIQAMIYATGVDHGRRQAQTSPRGDDGHQHFPRVG